MLSLPNIYLHELTSLQTSPLCLNSTLPLGERARADVPPAVDTTSPRGSRESGPTLTILQHVWMARSFELVRGGSETSGVGRKQELADPCRHDVWRSLTEIALSFLHHPVRPQPTRR